MPKSSGGAPVGPAAAPGDLRHCLAVAQELARLAGAELLRRFRRAARVELKGGKTDLVSDADRASEAIVLEFLRRHRPDDTILAEEGSAHTGRSRYRWVVDPLDGTVNYLAGVPFWCVSVGCERRIDGDWRPWLGVVYDPVHGELFRAVNGMGAFLGEVALRRVAETPLDEAILATGFAYARDHRLAQSAMTADLAADVRGIRMLGSTALALCWVAAGRLDIYVEDRTKRWDYSAGWPIAVESGAAVQLLDTILLAAPPNLMDDLASRVGTPGQTVPKD